MPPRVDAAKDGSPTAEGSQERPVGPLHGLVPDGGDLALDRISAPVLVLQGKEVGGVTRATVTDAWWRWVAEKVDGLDVCVWRA